jgi:predicted nucleotidyltransferase
MAQDSQLNLEVVASVARALGDLNNEVVYIGGAVISIYAIEPGADLPRVTEDIDVCVQVSTFAQMEELREQLAIRNIYPDPQGTHLYRYNYQGIAIDFIPFEETAFGPTNSWLKPGFEKAFKTTVQDVEIAVLPVSLFLATKWEAFKSRGYDPRYSHDFEDIIYVLDNNKNVVKDTSSATVDLIETMKVMSSFILDHANSNEIIECHINQSTAMERGAFITETLQEILEI